jgi:hypothetical protein
MTCTCSVGSIVKQGLHLHGYKSVLDVMATLCTCKKAGGTMYFGKFYCEPHQL